MNHTTETELKVLTDCITKLQNGIVKALSVS